MYLIFVCEQCQLLLLIPFVLLLLMLPLLLLMVVLPGH